MSKIHRGREDEVWDDRKVYHSHLIIGHDLGDVLLSVCVVVL